MIHRKSTQDAHGFPQMFREGSKLWLVVICVCAAALCLFSLAGCVLTVRNAVKQLELAAPPACSCASSVRALSASQEELQAAITEVANRVKMMRVRNAVNHVPDLPNDPASMKDALRKRAGLTAGKPARHL